MPVVREDSLRIVGHGIPYSAPLGLLEVRLRRYRTARLAWLHNTDQHTCRKLTSGSRLGPLARLFVEATCFGGKLL